jgi:hypothetical protein
VTPWGWPDLWLASFAAIAYAIAITALYFLMGFIGAED